MGISNSDLVASFNRLVDYMEGDAPDINVTVTINGESKQMFDYPQEAEHMVDSAEALHHHCLVSGCRRAGHADSLPLCGGDQF